MLRGDVRREARAPRAATAVAAGPARARVACARLAHVLTKERLRRPVRGRRRGYGNVHAYGIGGPVRTTVS